MLSIARKNLQLNGLWAWLAVVGTAYMRNGVILVLAALPIGGSSFSEV